MLALHRHGQRIFENGSKRRPLRHRLRARHLRWSAVSVRLGPVDRHHCRKRRFSRPNSFRIPKICATRFDPDDYFEHEDERILPNSHPLVEENGTGSETRASSQSQGEDDRTARRLFEFWKGMEKDMPKSWYHRALWLWERPVMKLGRLTVLFAQLPSLLTLMGSQLGFLAGQITLPMLAPLLFGAGILLRSIWVNAGYLFPRVSLTMLLLWGIWLLNSLLYKSVGYLMDQGTVSTFAAHAIMNWTEGLTLVTAGLVILSLFGVNISGLLLPAGICIALAAKDLTHNLLAGIVLFLAQPFQVGDEVFVQPAMQSARQGQYNWYEGVCERVDLRYTILRKGRYKLHVPNSSFITKEFLVLDKNYQLTSADDARSVSRERDDRAEADYASRSRANGSISEYDDLPSDVDYPAREIHVGDLNDLINGDSE